MKVISKFLAASSIALVVAVALLANATPTQAEGVVVIVNKNNTQVIDRATLVKIYTGATKYWADGSPIFALDQEENGEARNLFYADKIGKSPATIRTIWAQIIFSGRGLPPKVAKIDDKMKQIVATNKDAIGYVRSSAADDSVRVIDF